MAGLKRKLRERRGEIAPLGAVILLVAVILLAAALELNHTYAVIDQVIDKTNEAVLAAAASNAPAVHDGIREGTGTARHFNGLAWSRLVSTAAVTEALRASLDLTPDADGRLVREGGFALENVCTRYVNDDGGKLNFTTTMTVSIPLSLGGGVLPPTRIDLEVHTTYEPKF